jgi:hypothetical protein
MPTRKTQASLFFHAARLFAGALMWKQPLLHANQENQGKLESLDRMHGHQLHAVFPGVGLGLASFQCRVREKSVERGHIFLDQRIVFKTLTGADQFLQVLEA